jgi:hypothetical protein
MKERRCSRGPDGHGENIRSKKIVSEGEQPWKVKDAYNNDGLNECVCWIEIPLSDDNDCVEAMNAPAKLHSSPRIITIDIHINPCSHTHQVTGP